MNNNNLETRVATAEELDLLLSWAKREGWNPGLCDTELFYATDQSGFFITLLEGKPIAGISLVKFNDHHAFLGLYLCEPECRGKGYGMQTWNTALNSIGMRSVGLDGVVAQQSNYAREQFIYSHRNVRFAGNLDGRNIKTTGNAPSVIEATDKHVNALTLYDAAIGGFKRGAFYQAWLKSDTTRKTYLAVIDEKIIGAIGIRQCIEGFKIGPWLADDHRIAEALLNQAHKQTGNDSIMVDVPEPNQVAMEIAKRFKLSPIFETARMYRGQKPEINIEKLFGVATLELG